MPAITAPDFRTPGRDVRRLQVTPGAKLRLLVLAVDGTQCVGVDAASGALIRAWGPGPAAEPLAAYDLVEGILDGDLDAIPDPAQPEAVVLSCPPERVGRMTGRRAERLLRPLLHPEGQPLLGIHAPTVLFWQRRADHPSIALVDPEGPLWLHRQDKFLAVRFCWQGLVRELPCLDGRLAVEMDRSGQNWAVGRKGDRLLVALTPPVEGHCHKVVAAVLPRP